MLFKHHDLEAYYLRRRLELLDILDDFGQHSLHDEDFHLPPDHPTIKMLEEEYSDVIDPENVCQTLKRIYPERWFAAKSAKNKK